MGYTVEEHAEAQFPALHLALGNGDVDWGVESEGFWPLFFPTETLSLLNVNLF